ncbi:MAG: helix-turn-helix domain-containing protein [Chloroflexi bacterium]|nr:helix-turn-helix domain-containing protein [Chloroflexota bacterium]
MLIAEKAGPKTYTIHEAAGLLGIGRSAAYDAAKNRGEIAGIRVLRVGGRLLVPRAPLDRLLNGESVAA